MADSKSRITTTTEGVALAITQSIISMRFSRVEAVLNVMFPLTLNATSRFLFFFFGRMSTLTLTYIRTDQWCQVLDSILCRLGTEASEFGTCANTGSECSGESGKYDIGYVLDLSSISRSKPKADFLQQSGQLACPSGLVCCNGQITRKNSLGALPNEDLGDGFNDEFASLDLTDQASLFGLDNLAGSSEADPPLFSLPEDSIIGEEGIPLNTFDQASLLPSDPLFFEAPLSDDLGTIFPLQSDPEPDYLAFFGTDEGIEGGDQVVAA